MNYKLSEICDITSSKRIFANEYVKEGIPFYRGKEITQKSLGEAISTELYISEKKYREIKENFGVTKENDILITAVGTLGNIYFVKNENFYFKDGNLIWLKNYNEKIILPKFLFYLLNSKKAQKVILENSIGSTQKAITIDSLKNMEINLPSLKEQQKIVDILSPIDEKIELNNKINKILEDIAQLTYKQWFIDFEFPNEEGKPYKSSGGKMIYNEELDGEIPEGWDVNCLSSVVNFENGYSYSGSDLTNSDIGMMTIKNFNTNGSGNFDKFKEVSALAKFKYKHEANLFDIFLSCTDVTQNADIIGNVVILLSKSKYSKIIYSMDLLKIVPKVTMNKMFAFRSLTDERFKRTAVGCTSGTTVLHLNKCAIQNYKILIPHINVQNHFGIFAQTLYQKISTNILELILLKNQKEILLNNFFGKNDFSN